MANTTSPRNDLDRAIMKAESAVRTLLSLVRCARRCAVIDVKVYGPIFEKQGGKITLTEGTVRLDDGKLSWEGGGEGKPTLIFGDEYGRRFHPAYQKHLRELRETLSGLSAQLSHDVMGREGSKLDRVAGWGEEAGQVLFPIYSILDSEPLDQAFFPWEREGIGLAKWLESLRSGSRGDSAKMQVPTEEIPLEADDLIWRTVQLKKTGQYSVADIAQKVQRGDRWVRQVLQNYAASEGLAKASPTAKWPHFNGEEWERILRHMHCTVEWI